jgi:hypothetical protein
VSEERSHGPDDPEGGAQPWADTTGRHFDDQRLRHHGFEIVARPRRGPNRWRRRNRDDQRKWDYFTEAEAHATRTAEIEAVGKKRK